LSRFTALEIAQLAIERGITASISGTMVLRRLDDDSIKPWQYRSWIFPRDPFQWKFTRDNLNDIIEKLQPWKNAMQKCV
jgi:hypothetical protein